MSLNIYENGELKKVAGSYKVDSFLSDESKNAVQNKVVKHAIDEVNTSVTELDTNKQSKTDANLTTESKEIVGAVNELNKNLIDSQWQSDNNSTLGSRKVANDKIASALIGYVDTSYDRASIEYRDYNGTTSIVNRLLIGFNNLGDFKIIGKSGSVSKSADLLTTDNGRKYIPIHSSTTSLAPNETFTLDVSSYDFNYFEIHYYAYNGVRQQVLLPKSASCNFEVIESSTNRSYAQSANASGGTMKITNKSTVNLTIYKIFAVKTPA